MSLKIDNELAKKFFGSLYADTGAADRSDLDALLTRLIARVGDQLLLGSVPCKA